jgi:hypothetical protein
MAISFSSRGIKDSIISILHNIYYYTVRWDLSVASFTGANKEYWQQLPQRIRHVQQDPEKIEVIIQELENLAKKDSERMERRQALIKNNAFQKKEVVINEQLLAILSAIPGSMLSEFFCRLTGDSVLSSPAKFVERQLGSGEQLIEPDFLVMAGSNLMMGEMKVFSKEKTIQTKYDANQLFNYFSLVVKCKMEKTYSMPQNFSHLILLPTIDYRWFIRGKEWIIDLQSGNDKRLVVNAEQCFNNAEKKKKQNYIKSYQDLEMILSKTPIYVRSYKDLLNSFAQSIDSYPLRDHWFRFYEEIKTLVETQK